MATTCDDQVARVINKTTDLRSSWQIFSAPTYRASGQGSEALPVPHHAARNCRNCTTAHSLSFDPGYARQCEVQFTVSRSLCFAVFQATTVFDRGSETKSSMH